MNDSDDSSGTAKDRRPAHGTPVDAAFAAHYAELLRLARARLAGEQAPISASTLAHELYLSLRGRGDLDFASRGAFLAYAGRAMRSLLIDMARERLALKRQAELLPLTLGSEAADLGGGTPESLLALNQAFESLGRIDPRLLQVAEMRAVLGMEVPEVAQVLQVSEPTVKRDWQRARAFLHAAVGDGPASGTPNGPGRPTATGGRDRPEATGLPEAP